MVTMTDLNKLTAEEGIDLPDSAIPFLLDLKVSGYKIWFRKVKTVVAAYKNQDNADVVEFFKPTF